MSFFAIPTIAGQTALAAALAGTAPLTLSYMVVGDGAGAATTPIQTQAALVNQVAQVSVQTVNRSVAAPNQVTVTAIIDENTGGFTIRELGLLDSDGTLLFVANCPDTEKQTIAAGVDDVLTLGMTIVVSAAATINLVVPATTYATQEFVETALDLFQTNIATPLRPYFLAVISASLSTPPASPSIGDTYLVGSSAALGAWLGKERKLAQWAPISPTGAPARWVFASPPVGTMIGIADTADYWKLTGSGWRSIFATTPEHLAGTSTQLTTHPAGVAAMISQAFSTNLPLMGVLWCGTSGGSANVQTLTPSMVVPSYATGAGFSFKAGFSNSSALTINISGVGAKSVFCDGETGAVALTGGEVVAGEIYTLRYDGTQFQLTATEQGTASLKNMGATVNDPGTGALEIAEPVSASSGASYSFVTTDRGLLKVRSNSGAAMTDSLPSVFANGWTTTVKNNDATAVYTLAVPSGVSIDGVTNGTVRLQPGQSTAITSDGAAYWSALTSQRLTDTASSLAFQIGWLL